MTIINDFGNAMRAGKGPIGRATELLTKGAIVAITALSISLSGVASVEARPARRNDDLTAFLAAMAAMAIIASTVNNSHAAPRPAEPPRSHPPRPRKVLPRRCLSVVPGPYGGKRLLYRAWCLERRVTRPLPEICRTSAWIGGRYIPVYRGRCLARRGWLI